MNERDIRTIENMARIGIEFEDLCKAFKKFPVEEIKEIFLRVRNDRYDSEGGESDIKVNCS